MADAKRVTILNQREGKIVLPPDPEELESNPKAKGRELLGGQTIEVSAEEAKKLLRYKGLIDISTIVKTAESAEVRELKAKLAAAEAENLRLKEAGNAGAAGDNADDEAAKAKLAAEKAAAKAAAAERKKIMKKGARVLMQDGGLGTVVKVHPHKKGAEDDEVDVQLDVNGNVSPFLVSTLKLAPEA